MLAEFKAFLTAMDRVFHIFKRDVLQFVNVKAFLTGPREETQHAPHAFAATRVQAEPGQVFQTGVTDRAVRDRCRSSLLLFGLCSTGSTGSTGSGSNVFDAACADLKSNPNCLRC